MFTSCNSEFSKRECNVGFVRNLFVMAPLKHWNLWILCIFIIVYFCDALLLPYPKIKSLMILNDTLHVVTNRRLLVEFSGEHLNNGFELTVTRNDSQCFDVFDYKIEQIWTAESNAKFVIILPLNITTDLYFCMQYNDFTNSVHFGGEVIKWNHVGKNIFIKFDTRPKDDSSRQRFYPVSHNPK